MPFEPAGRLRGPSSPRRATAGAARSSWRGRSTTRSPRSPTPPRRPARTTVRRPRATSPTSPGPRPRARPRPERRAAEPREDGTESRRRRTDRVRSRGDDTPAGRPRTSSVRGLGESRPCPRSPIGFIGRPRLPPGEPSATRDVDPGPSGDARRRRPSDRPGPSSRRPGIARESAEDGPIPEAGRPGPAERLRHPGSSADPASDRLGSGPISRRSLVAGCAVATAQSVPRRGARRSRGIDAPGISGSPGTVGREVRRASRQAVRSTAGSARIGPHRRETRTVERPAVRPLQSRPRPGGRSLRRQPVGSRRPGRLGGCPARRSGSAAGLSAGPRERTSSVGLARSGP